MSCLFVFGEVCRMSPEVMYAFHFYAGTHSFLLPRLRQYASQIPIFATDSWPMFCC